MYFLHKGEILQKRYMNPTRKKSIKTECIYHTRAKYSKRCINRTRKKCIKEQCIYHTRVKYSKTMHQSQKEEMHQNKNYLPHKVETHQKWCINRIRKKCIKTQCIYYTRVKYNKDDASIAKGRNASNKMYWPQKGEIQQKRYLSHKDKKQHTHVLPHV